MRSFIILAVAGIIFLIGYMAGRLDASDYTCGAPVFVPEAQELPNTYKIITNPRGTWL